MSGHVNTGWHLDPATIERYAAGATSDAVAASAEAHLTACVDCRSRLAPAVPAPRLNAIFAEVEDRIDAGTLPVFERLLVRLGLPSDTARLLAATPALGAAWLTALGLSVAFAAVAATTSERGLFAFLTLAPVLPVAGVAMSYGRHADPAYELAVASPYSMLRLLLIRAVAVVGTTLTVTALGGLLLLDSGWQSAAWLLPALALSLVTLALSAWTAPVWAATGVISTWVMAVSFTWRTTGMELAAFGAKGQLLAGALLLVALGALLAQRNAFAYDSRRSS